jgi:hypothetical protein
MDMLCAHCEAHDRRARELCVPLVADPFVFSPTVDGGRPLAPDFVTHRVAVLKQHLGIDEKRPETIALEDEALRLHRGERAARPAGRPGPAPTGAMSYAEIGRQLGRTGRWASAAVAAAERREQVGGRPGRVRFDGSILALRKFTSTELLDAGFNISMVAQRQGHGPAVLIKHYAKARASADRRAAEHLGRIVHGTGDVASGR